MPVILNFFWRFGAFRQARGHTILGFTHIQGLASKSGPSPSGSGFLTRGIFGGSAVLGMYLAMYCSEMGYWSVVVGRKDSRPMSQSRSPGIWPWRLYQNSRFFSFISIFSGKIGGRFPKGQNSISKL